MDFFAPIIDWILNKIEYLAAIAAAALPSSPFTFLEKNETVSNIIGYANYFIPFDFFIATLEVWLSAVVVYYIWQGILRWTKAVS